MGFGGGGSKEVPKSKPEPIGKPGYDENNPKPVIQERREGSQLLLGDDVDETAPLLKPKNSY